jgi:hypothetical protein
MNLSNLAMPGLAALQHGLDATPPAGEFLRIQHGFQFAGLILASAVALYACMLALQLLVIFLAPGITQRGAERVQSSPYRSLLVGVAAGLVLTLLGAACQRVGPLVVIFLPAHFLLTVGGVVVISHDIGRRVFELSGRSGSRFGRVSAGWAVCMLASSIPYLGWLVIGPLLLLMGAGGFVLAFFTRSGGAKAEPAVVPLPDPPAAPAGGSV